MNSIKSRIDTFCQQHRLRVPILQAPMAGACPPPLAIAVANAGGLGACGALFMQPAEIAAWVAEVRANTQGPFQINLWIPDPEPQRDAEHEAAVRTFLQSWGPAIPETAGDAKPPDFDAQCAALLATSPPIVSSVMGLYPASFVAQLKARNITWFANVSTVAEAKAAQSAGANVIVAQGMEAGGHRGCFDARTAEQSQVGLFALLPAVVDAVNVPVVATGGIADARGVAAAFMLGASAVQIGTGFLRSPEAKAHPAWANALASTAPEDTTLTRVFSGRAGRSINTAYVRAAMRPDAPTPAPYPVQRGLTAPMRADAQRSGDVERMQAWAGQSARLARNVAAGEIMRELWEGAQKLMP